MKTALRGVVSYCAALYVTSFILPGLHINGGFNTILWGGILLAIGYMLVKPLLSIISLPITMITMGIFSLILIAAIFFGITQMNHNITVTPFKTHAMQFGHIHIPTITFSGILSYLAISVTIYCIARAIQWIFSD